VIETGVIETGVIETGVIEMGAGGDNSYEDSGAAVRGFGSDVPAFMLLRPRVAPVEGREGDTEA
jgi:hypothetical protein